MMRLDESFKSVSQKKHKSEFHCSCVENLFLLFFQKKGYNSRKQKPSSLLHFREMNQLQPYYKFHLAVYFFDNLTQCCLFSFIHRNNLHCVVFSFILIWEFFCIIDHFNCLKITCLWFLQILKVAVSVHMTKIMLQLVFVQDYYYFPNSLFFFQDLKKNSVNPNFNLLSFWRPSGST